jgi:hypothetical protein
MKEYFLPYVIMEAYTCSIFLYLEFQTMDKVQKLSNSEVILYIFLIYNYKHFAYVVHAILHG